MKALVIAGGIPQIELIKQLKARNIYTILLDGNSNAVAVPYADEFFAVNIFDIDQVKNIAQEQKVDFLITCCADQVLLVVAQVSEMLGLPCYIDYQTAKNVSDKELMKRLFVENNIPTSQYVVMEKLDISRVRGLRYPLIVKPVDAYSSRGVCKVCNEEELCRAFDEAVRISRSKNAIVEEFCEGEEISVDVFVAKGKAHILCVSNSEKIKDENKFVIFRGKFPITASKTLLNKIESVAQQIADAFHITDAPMLIQMISNGESVSVLEFCARTGGAMKYLLIQHVCGFDVIQAVIDLTLGNEIQVVLRDPENKYIVNDFIYCKEGVFDHLEGFDELVAIGALKDYRQLRPSGFVTSGQANSSGDRVAGMTIQADSIEEFNRLHEMIVNGIKVIDTTGNDITRRELLPGLHI